ncbi:thiolase family protein [Peribacillus butanolivorans]|uniref:thiolase family protein n=1 Tax=Peribacillus butanolivorans TaxID=421767 RepID=UPI0036522A85
MYFYRRTAENVAETYHTSRKAQDAFALGSQRRPKLAIDSRDFNSQIVLLVCFVIILKVGFS